MAKRKKEQLELEEDPLWYKDAIIYQLHVRAYYDSSGDGVGDFRGLSEKLGYLKELGVTAVWLLPFYPSPLRDEGYDIADYTGVHPDYGTIRDFKEFVREAHRQGLRVITELVLNHTSDQHPWFQRARQAKPGSWQREFYVWSETPERYKEARIIFQDFESSNWAWDPVARAYYWHRFYSHQPDLNYENPRVRKAIFSVVDFWFRLGVDGLRLDGVPYLYEREGTNCENLPETHEFLRELSAHVRSRYRNRMLLAEANQWPEDAMTYFGDGDECQMVFHFPVMPRLFMALSMEDRFPVIDIMEQTPSIPESCQWALFLRNHDELTLEMVTDEERDYMYRVYARDPRQRLNLGIRRRLAPLMGNNRRRIELLNVLLFSLPGAPLLYYGDEIGMGDNYYLGDRAGVRTPMQWSPDRNAGFSKGNPHELYLPVIIDPEYHYETVNVENQERNLSSLLWWTRRVIGMRKRFRAFGRGSIEFVNTNNSKILAFIREYEEEKLLLVVNLSRFSQAVELELAKYAGHVPEEVFSQNEFPVITESPYVLTMGFNDYFWFVLRKQKEDIVRGERREVPELSVRGSWENVLAGRQKAKLEERILPGYLKRRRWFAGKARTIRGAEIMESIAIGEGPDRVQVLLVQVWYTEGSPEVYQLPVSYGSQELALKLGEECPQAVIARVQVDGQEGILYDSAYDERFRELLVELMARRRKLKGKQGELAASPGRRLRMVLRELEKPLSSQVLKGEQSNTSILYEDVLILKLYRRLEEGINPDGEMVRFLTERAGYYQVPPFAGALEYRRGGAEQVALALLQGYEANEGDAWTYTLDAVRQCFERVLGKKGELEEVPERAASLLEVRIKDLPALVEEVIGGFYLEMTELLGRRTGELHCALSSSEDPMFSPEPFSKLYQRSVYQSMRSLMGRVVHDLRGNLGKIPEELRAEAREVLGREGKILGCFARIMERRISSMKIRIHGDYHLGQVLYTGKDFVVIDFEGEPWRALGERRLKRCPFRDVAGMIRSFHYAVYSGFLQQVNMRPEDREVLEPWVELWYEYVSGVFLGSYLETVKEAAFVPHEREEIQVLLDAFMLEKAVYELGYELNNRPDWVVIPLQGIREILRSRSRGH